MNNRPTNTKHVPVLSKLHYSPMDLDLIIYTEIKYFISLQIS